MNSHGGGGAPGQREIEREIHEMEGRLKRRSRGWALDLRWWFGRRGLLWPARVGGEVLGQDWGGWILDREELWRLQS